MQFAVPQFTDVEDKLIGPLTLKQFLVLVAAGGLCLMFWSLPIPKIISILIDIPIAGIGLGLAFATYNSRPALTYIFPLINYLISPKLMVFKRETNIVQVNTPEVKKAPEPIAAAGPVEGADSRLRKLAYLLDRKTAEEKELLETKETEILKISAPVRKPSKPDLEIQPSQASAPIQKKSPVSKPAAQRVVAYKSMLDS